MENYQVTQPQTTPMQQQQSYMQQPIAPAQNTQAAQPTQPATSASGVNIMIYNPTANGGSGGLPQAYPSNYYLQPPVFNNNNNFQPQMPQQPQATTPVAEQPQAAAPMAETKTENKKTGKTKKVIELTDDYIKTLENYLRNPNKETRMMGAKELAKRFEEDDTRKNDRALNALLDLALQDKSADVRALALATISGGLAQGDDTTVKLLQQMQKSNSAYGLDALNATDALLKMSGNTIEIPDNSPDKPKKQKEETEETK
ncbi:MAG: hypothetical protein PHV37_00135 [Candidatus Gastranaerophilales bacterium]|nr:hypothetical protein [Candidatus Gastranaerophilales bacterium]